jgi:hypothetical protein
MNAETFIEKQRSAEKTPREYNTTTQLKKQPHPMLDTHSPDAIASRANVCRRRATATDSKRSEFNLSALLKQRGNVTLQRKPARARQSKRMHATLEQLRGE